MIAPTAEVRFGFRPLPTMDPDQLLQPFRTLVEPQPAEFDETFRGASLPAGDTANAEAPAGRARHSRRTGDADRQRGGLLDRGGAVLRCRLHRFVYGPGDIAQAHSADEWVDARLSCSITQKPFIGSSTVETHKHTRKPSCACWSMGSAKEIQQYLKRFSQLDAKRFAVVKVGGAVLRDELADLTSSLTFLQQVGLRRSCCMAPARSSMKNLPPPASRSRPSTACA
jgi:hypothetical protein